MTAGRVKEITSLTNPIIKDLRGLMQKKNREREGVFLTEGLKLVLEGLALGAKIRSFIYASAEATPLTEDVAARAYAAGALIIKANRKIMEAICHRDNAQNVVGVFEQSWCKTAALLNGDVPRPQAGGNLSFTAAANEKAAEPQSPAAINTKNQGKLYLALDRVRDPGNLGTIIRTADAVGADGIILIGDTVSPYAPEAVRATMGSIFALPLARLSEAEFLPIMARFRGLKLGAHLQGAVDYRSIDYFHNCQKEQAGENNVLLLMGNEQSGLTNALTESCDKLARIPQTGRADSLNLAVSTALMLYEICRPRLKL